MSRFSRASQKKRHGATYTPPLLARLLARRVVDALPESSKPVRVLDPFCGDGALLEAVVDAWKPSCGRLEVVGVDRDVEAVAQARRRLALRAPGRAVREADFLQDGLGEESLVDVIVANPPWVRAQVLGAKRAQAIAKDWGLSGRIDLAQAGVLAIVASLRPRGLAAVLVPNKLLVTRGAARFRSLMRERVELLEVGDLGDTRLFDAAVLPAVLVFRVGPQRSMRARFWSVYTTPDVEDAVEDIGLDQVWDRSGRRRLPDGRVFEVLHGELAERGPARTWQRGGPAVDAWLGCVRDHTGSTFGDLGPIRVGIKSTADPVFVRPDWDAMSPETRPELLRPLTTHHRAQRIRPLPAGRSSSVLYPHENRGGERHPVDLAGHPRSRAWLEAHRDRLEARRYVREAGRRWYELWVPHDPDGWTGPKLVFRDIAPCATFWLDAEHTVVNGDCYWLKPFPEAPAHALWVALAVAASSFVDAWYDRVCNNRLYAGRRRYFTQYVAQFPLPDLDGPVAADLAERVQTLYAELSDTPPCALADRFVALDHAVWQAFGLDPSTPPP